MANSKNAKKRRSKNQRKANVTDNAGPSRSSPDESPARSPSPTLSSNALPGNEFGLSDEKPETHSALEPTKSQNLQIIDEGIRDTRVTDEENAYEQPHIPNSQNGEPSNDALEQESLLEKDSASDKSSTQQSMGEESAKLTSPGHVLDVQLSPKELGNETRQDKIIDVNLEGMKPTEYTPDEEKLVDQKPQNITPEESTPVHQLDDHRAEEHKFEDWRLEKQSSEVNDVPTSNSLEKSKIDEAVRNPEVDSGLTEETPSKYRLGAPFEEGDYPTLRKDTEAAEPEEKTEELLVTPRWHAGSSGPPSPNDEDKNQVEIPEVAKASTEAPKDIPAELPANIEKVVIEDVAEEKRSISDHEEASTNVAPFNVLPITDASVSDEILGAGEESTDQAKGATAPEFGGPEDSEDTTRGDGLAAEPTIPQRSVARDAETGNVVMLEATRQPLRFARPVMLKEVQDTGDGSPPEQSSADQEPQNTEFFLQDDDEFDPDLYFDEPEDAIVVSAVKQELPPTDLARAWPSGSLAQGELETRSLAVSNANQPENLPLDGSCEATAESESPEQVVPPHGRTASVSSDIQFEFEGSRPQDDKPIERQDALTDDPKDPRILQEMKLPDPIEDTNSSPEQAQHLQTGLERSESVRSKPGMIRRVGDDDPKSKGLDMPFSSPSASPRTQQTGRLGPQVDLGETLTPPLPPNSDWSPRSKSRVSARTVASEYEEPLSSPNASPRPYKYAQSPLPDRGTRRAEPPIFGVCVVGFHHQRGPEVEYWVGPEESRSSMWPYLPFQSLPDGSHQFEENICYFTLLYDRNKSTSASLTFSRDESGHIKEGTSDFRDVTTLFAIACSRQVPLADLDHIGDDEEYTRSIVQKSVVVIASKPIFGPIKEKLAMVTRSFFDQRNFGDHAIIDHLYANLLQMPLWVNENDLQVGMNLQRVVRDFGEQVLVILKAMLLEVKILFYASDTDILGTTQFALVSLIPNLINHLEDCGSPLLSSYELNLQAPESLKSTDRASLLKYAGFPLQIFAGGGVLAPFVPLQQFDDLRQPETRYGMIGTTNNLFLGTEIDFDMVINVDKHEVQIRNQDIVPLLKLTDADKAFTSEISNAVSKAWDAEDRWEPTALVYHGGEDYIRHEFEEYLIALLASAKYSKSLARAPSETESTHTSSSTPDEREAASSLQHWGKPWADKWMSTSNNFRIFDKNSDDNLFHFLETSHPGVKLLKPSGFTKFLGLFRPKRPNPLSKPGNGISTPQVQSPAASVPSLLRTPSVTGDEKFESLTPQSGDLESSHNSPEEES